MSPRVSLRHNRLALAFIDRDKNLAQALVISDRKRRTVTWVEARLWCADLEDCIASAFDAGGAKGLLNALGRHGLACDAAVILAAPAPERVIDAIAANDGRSPPPSIDDWVAEYRPELGQSRALQRWGRRQRIVMAMIADRLADITSGDRSCILHADNIGDVLALGGIDARWEMKEFGPLHPTRLNDRPVLVSRPAPPLQGAANGPEMAVVIISVGAPAELTRAVASIQAQRPRPEIIVVNSGGGDVNARLPKGCADATVVSVDEVLWPGAARNRGIQAANAPFIAFLAADCVAHSSWVSGRLAHHRTGSDAVASAVVNDAPRNIIAWASHLNTFPTRLPHVCETKAPRYGASYARSLFVQHGLFREDLRIGEDTEFHRRLGTGGIVWAPEVRTAHRNPRTIMDSLSDKYARGQRSSRYWGGAKRSVRLRLSAQVASLRTAFEHAPGGEHGWYMKCAALLALLGIAVNELGFRRGRRDPEPGSLLEPLAANAMRKRKWKTALRLWREARKAQPAQIQPRLGEAQALLMLELHRPAAKAYQHVVNIWPDCIVGIEGKARSLAGTGDWPKADNLWRRSDRMLPGRKTPPLERAATRLKLGDPRTARRLFQAVVDRFPDEAEAYSGLATALLAIGRIDQALAVHDQCWDRLRTAAILERKVDLLLGLQRLDEARLALVPLRDSAQDNLAAWLRASSAVMVASHDWDGTAGLLLDHAPLVKRDAVLLDTLCNALATLGRAPEASEFLERDVTIPARRLLHLRLMALLRERRDKDAVPLFQEIWSDPGLGRITTNLFAPMITAAWEVGGGDLAHQVLDRVEANDNFAGRLANQRMFVPLHRYRATGLSMLFQGDEISPPARPLEVELQRAVATERDRKNGSLDYEVLEQALSGSAALRSSHSDYYPDPGFVLSDALAVVERILDAFDNRRPFSLIRLGDGEGHMLPYHEEIAGSQAADQAATMRSWWGGKPVDPRAIAALTSEFRTALLHADMIGAPSLERLFRGTGKGQRHHYGSGGRNARGLLAVSEWLASTPPRQAITSCHVHQALSFWGLWQLLLPRVGAVSLITCRTDLPAQLQRRFDVSVRRVWHTPVESKYAEAAQRTTQAAHYPDVFEQLRIDLTSVEPGEVVLVAAGFLGKIYCQWIRACGGIAIDIGSAADYWCGLETRSVLESSEYRGPTKIADQYERHRGHPTVARLMTSEA